MNQWVEASAGSGKTTDLVTQVLALVKEGQAEIPQIAAITFTEKAAGELKLRVRQKLESERRSAQGEVLGRLDQAVRQLEQAHFQTIHGFCQELLQERPVEARIDPLFTVLNAGETRSLFRECFHDWFQANLQSPPPGLARLLRRRFVASDYQGRPSGVRPSLEKLAARLVEHRDQTRPWSMPDPSWQDEIPGLWAEFLTISSADPGTIGYQNLQDLRVELALVRETSSVLPVDVAEEREALLCRCRKALRNQKEPSSRMKGGNLAFAQPLYEWKLRLDSWAARADADLMARVRQELQPLLDDFEGRKARLGRLDFLDLLLHTRELLRDPSLRLQIQSRYRFLFVDEFQDTDPVQADIVALLSDGGSLYVVGDPKQAIYRFRRGDLAVYAAFKQEQDHLERRYLNNNYRSLPSLVEFFNSAFSGVFQEDANSLQAGFQAMVACPQYPEGQPSPEGQPAVSVLPFAECGGTRKVGALRAEMATQTAAYLDWLLHHSGFLVRDEAHWRPVQSRDVCLLFRALSQNLQPTLEALDARSIPHLSLSGKGLHQREEVEALRTALEAIEWPQDTLSVFASLRGPFFGLEEPELFAYHRAHRHFNPLLADAGDGPVGEALALLAQLHEERNRRPAGETIERILASSGASIHFGHGPQGSQCLANLSRLARLAWSFEARGTSSFRKFVEHLLELAEEESGAEGMAPDDALDGVRILTVHSSKGLEFPVVVLADPASQPLHFAIREASEGDLYTCGLDDLYPAEFAGLREREERITRAESDRLAYVAATRARDLLVVPGVTDFDSWLVPLIRATTPAMIWNEENSPAQRPRNVMDGARLFANDGDPSAGIASGHWRRAQEALRRGGQGGMQIVSRMPAEIEVEVVRVGPGGGGRETGRRLHDILARVEFASTREAVEQQAQELGARVWAVLQSSIWKEGWRELPLTVQIAENTYLEGVADLVYREGEGYTVVDFKSDGDRPEYRQQLAGYARAIHESTGLPVRAVMALI